MHRKTWLALALVVGAAIVLIPRCEVGAEGEADRRLPTVGYLYPAGGQEGTVFEVLAGGQNLRGPIAAHVSGAGVQARIVKHMRPLNFQQQRELWTRVRGIKRTRQEAAAAAREAESGRKRPKKNKRKRGAKKGNQKEKVKKDPVELPKHALLDDLGSLSDAELDRVLIRFTTRSAKRQPNAQIAETVELELEIAPDAAPGWREIRLETRGGLTNPVRFQVGTLREVCEQESLATDAATGPALDLPVLVNGQILPGDIDRHRFRATRGQRLAISVAARDLVPFLADAVPGWFQATLAIHDSTGRELAYADDFDFEPDPRLVFDVPADGEYVVEIHDSIHRGREDFVYRLSLAEDATRAWTPSRGDTEKRTVSRAADGLDVCPEVEPNDSSGTAQGILPPQVVRGRIEFPGDTDSYAFSGRAGDDIVIEIQARRDFSPLDAVVRLADPSGEIIAWSDDHPDALSGLLTHPADPYLHLRLPQDGAYVVHVADVRGHGSARHAYRLRVSAPRPSYEVVVTPSSLTVPSGRAVPFRVHAVRRDGFDGAIDCRLIDAPQGFRLTGGRIPEGVSSVRMTLTAPVRRPAAPLVLQLEGSASIGEHVVTRTAMPADDRMQAFLWRHLVPAQEWLVSVGRGGRKTPPVERLDAAPVRIPARRTVSVEFRVPGLSAATVLHARLDAAPPGIALDGWDIAEGRFTLRLRAVGEERSTPLRDNLIVAVYADTRNGKGGTRRVFAGYLPAIPVVLPAR